MPIVEVSGNYGEVIQQLGLSGEFNNEPLKQVDYDSRIQQDLPRVCYFDEDIRTMKHRLADRSHLLQNQLLYNQGNLDGRFFSVSAYLTGAYRALQASALEEDKRKPGENLAFSYLDDSAQLCGLSIEYYNKSQFIITVIKGVTQPIDNRKVHYFTQPEFIPNEAGTKQNLPQNSLVNCVEKAINSKKVNGLLKGIITEDDYLLEQPFLELKGRFSADKNIEEKGSFFQRNAGNLILAGIAFLGVVAVLLTLTGVLAPVGLGLGIIAIAGAVVLGAFSTHEPKRESESSRETDVTHHDRIPEFQASAAKTPNVERTTETPVQGNKPGM